MSLADGRCFGRTGTEDIRADMAILQFDGPGAHEIADGSLSRAIDAEGRCAFGTRDGTRENDRAAIVE